MLDNHYNLRSVFHSPWWLESVVENGEYGYTEIKENNQLVASLPWVLNISKLGKKYLVNPPLTQTLGPWVKEIDPNQKHFKKIKREKQLIGKLIDKLPNFDYFEQNFSPEITNWMPFYWKGFSQTTKYTYRLNNQINEDSLWKGLETKIRTNIKKALSNKLTVDVSDDIDAFIKLHSLSFESKGLDNPYSNNLIKKIHKACQENNASSIFFVKDKYGRIHSATYIIFNKYCTYYLMGARNPNFKDSFSLTLAIWESIKFSRTKSNFFDFEGSMIENIESFFRGFGAIQTPYFTIKKNKSKTLKTIKLIKELL